MITASISLDSKTIQCALLVFLLALFFAPTTTAHASSNLYEGDDDVLYTHLVFQEDFEGEDLTEWHISIEEEGASMEIEMEESNHVLAGKGHVWSEMRDDEWSNYVFEVKVKLMNENSGTHLNFCIGPLDTDSWGRYWLFFSAHQLHLGKNMDGDSFELVWRQVNIKLGRWYTVTITCFRGDIKIYVDEGLMLSYNDDEPLFKGGIGLEPLPHSYVLFDDVKVSLMMTVQDIQVLLDAVESEIDQMRALGCDVDEAELKMGEAVDAWSNAEFDRVPQLVEDALHIARMASLNSTLYTYVIFYDNFEDGDAVGWSIELQMRNAFMGVTQLDGNFVLSGCDRVWSYVGDRSWSNYVCELKVMFLTDHFHLRFNFRMKGGSQRYIVAIYESGFELKMAHGDEFPTLVQERAAFSPLVWYRLKVVCFENSIGIYVDGVLRMIFTDLDEPYLSGNIGIEPLEGCQAYFDDVMVYCITSNIDDLLENARLEIDKAMALGADVSEAEQKLGEATDARTRGENELVMQLVQEAVELAWATETQPKYLALAIGAVVAPIVCLILWLEATLVRKRRFFSRRGERLAQRDLSDVGEGSG